MKPCYQKGNVTLYHSDCAADLPALGKKPDMILTSPPYDLMLKYGGVSFAFDPVADALIYDSDRGDSRVDCCRFNCGRFGNGDELSAGNWL